MHTIQVNFIYNCLRLVGLVSFQILNYSLDKTYYEYSISYYIDLNHDDI